MSFGPAIDQLLEALRCLPGVGPKSAQRMALHLLERDRQGGVKLAKFLQQAMEQVGHCRLCRTLTELDVCQLCANQSRDQSQLCIVETPADVLAVEQAGSYRGLYFVLLGKLSPIDGIGPNDIGIPLLLERLENNEATEIILATNSTVEGEATAHYIAERVKALPIQVSRIAYGVPIGGELEYVDGSTLVHAFAGRKML